MAVSEKSVQDKIEASSILEEIEKERENDDLGFSTKYSHKEDLENLLRLAEELKKKIDSIETEIDNYRKLLPKRILTFGFVSIVYFFIFLLIPKVINDPYLYEVAMPASIVITILLLGSSLLVPIYFTNRSIHRLKEKNFPDKVALREVLQLLRETSNIIASQEEWSVLSRAEFRIRLSRFNLEESNSTFNFFS